MKIFFYFIFPILLVIFLFWYVEQDFFKHDAKVYIQRWEGYRTTVYRDSLGVETIGIGFNLRTHPELASLVSIQRGSLTRKQTNFFFDQYVSNAIIDTRKIFPSFESQPRVVKLILVDMNYQLGPTGMRSFKKFRAAIESHSYYIAAQELMNSKWAKQSGRRAIEHIDVLKKLQ